MTEGIAHNDDVITYTRNDDKVQGQAGRILAIKTLMWIGKRNSDAIKNIDLQSSKSKDELLKDFAETVTELTRTGMKSITQAE